MISSRSLSIILGKLQSFSSPSLKLEQYATPVHIAADWIWDMVLRGEVSGRTILDAACGPGILGIGLLLLGAKRVYFVDKDEKIMKVCMDNVASIEQEYTIGEAKFVVSDISLFDEKVDVVVQNPPFGTKEEHIDKRFLEKAFVVAPLVYSMHKWSTATFVEAMVRDYKFRITEVKRYGFPIKAAFSFHTKPVKDVEVGLWRMEKE